jgi:hypothetical protein
MTSLNSSEKNLVKWASCVGMIQMTHEHENTFLVHGRLSEDIVRDSILGQGLILERRESYPIHIDKDLKLIFNVIIIVEAMSSETLSLFYT